jgi:hypothetical protein
MVKKDSPAIEAFKVWIFPSLVSIMAMMILNDVSEIKADIKVLMAQSNIDKTRIDNIERQVYRASASYPAQVPPLPIINKMVAVLPNKEIKIENEKVLPRPI